MPAIKKKMEVFDTAPVKVGRKFITVKLPAKLKDIVDFESNSTFWTVTDGIIQISGAAPKTTVPMLIDPDKY